MAVPRIEKGRTLRIVLDKPAVVRWSSDDWAVVEETPTRYSSFGVEIAELPTFELASGQRIRFTFRMRQTRQWEGRAVL